MLRSQGHSIFKLWDLTWILTIQERFTDKVCNLLHSDKLR